MSKEYDKLIRDLIPEKLDGKGIKYGVHVADDEEYKTKLKEKLVEEAQEVLEAGEDELIEELADLAEVLEATMEACGISEGDLAEVRNAKNEKRGAFSERLILEWTEEN